MAEPPKCISTWSSTVGLHSDIWHHLLFVSHARHLAWRIGLIFWAALEHLHAPGRSHCVGWDILTYGITTIRNDFLLLLYLIIARDTATSNPSYDVKPAGLDLFCLCCSPTFTTECPALFPSCPTIPIYPLCSFHNVAITKSWKPSPPQLVIYQLFSNYIQKQSWLTYTLKQQRQKQQEREHSPEERSIGPHHVLPQLFQ